MRKRIDLQPYQENEDSKELLLDDEHSLLAEEQNKGAPVGDWRGDRRNIALLLFLYLLQGIPLGLIASIPLMLQNRHVSYKEQAEFSLVFWPFSLKLLWAPIVDSLYSPWMGRRKSWLVPVQYLLGVTMLILSTRVEGYLDAEGAPSVKSLTLGFLILNFLAATQDIAVDGWALTMLHKRNIGYASTCNSVGQTAGYFLGYVLFVAFESPDFCNKYLRSEAADIGMITLPGFLYFWGIVFMITTTLVVLFKKEKDDQKYDPATNLSVVETYKLLISIFRLPAVKLTVVVLLTCKMGFSASDSLLGLKLIEKGIPKAQLALLAVPLVPLQIILPLIISRYTAGPRPMNIFLKAFPYRLMFGFMYVALVWVTPLFRSQEGDFPFYYYVLVVIIFALHQITVYSMFVAVMAFFAQVSDPAVGGTYMTLLNTVCNLGGNWPSTLALWSVDNLTWKSCHAANQLRSNSCHDPGAVAACTNDGGQCETDIDGFYLESLICVAIGFLWLQWGRKAILKLQAKEERAWKVAM